MSVQVLYLHRWQCLGCDDKGTGDAKVVQRAAEKHTKATQHGTLAGTVRVTCPCVPVSGPHQLERCSLARFQREFTV